MDRGDRHLYEIELDVQNQELRNSRALLEETLDLYANLYDYAAVACFSFDSSGCIREMNLTGAGLLKEDRDYVVGKPFSQWLEPGSVQAFFSHLRKLNQGQAKVVTRLKLAIAGNEIIPVLLISTANPSDDEQAPVSFTHQSALIEIGNLDKV